MLVSSGHAMGNPERSQNLVTEAKATGTVVDGSQLGFELRKELFMATARIVRTIRIQPVRVPVRVIVTTTVRRTGK